MKLCLILSYRKDFESTPYDVAIIGDYNIGGDAWASRILLEEMGLRVIAQWSGDASYKDLAIAPKAKLNLLHCYRSMNYISKTYGTRIWYSMDGI
jgi:nitrogenase molybdenum-iron protein alpha chain